MKELRYDAGTGGVSSRPRGDTAFEEWLATDVGVRLSGSGRAFVASSEVAYLALAGAARDGDLWIQPGAAAPVNTAPAAFTPTISAITSGGATVTFATTDPESNPLTYKATVTTSATPPADWSAVSLRTSPWAVTGLTASTTYYAHVQASDGSLTRVGTSASFATSAAVAPVTFVNDFEAGQALDTTNLASVLAGSGSATVASNKLTVTTPAENDAAALVVQQPLDLTGSGFLEMKCQMTTIADVTWFGGLSVVNAATKPTAASAATNNKLNLAFYRGGGFYVIRVLHNNVSDVLKWWNSGGAAWADTASTNITFVAGTTYYCRIAWEYNAGTPRWRYLVGTTSGGSQVLVTDWVNFSATKGTTANYWWLVLGDLANDFMHGTLTVLSITRG